MRYLISLLSLLLLWQSATAETLRLVATTTSMAMLARTVGAEQVQIKTLAPPDRDVHTLQAKPSMMKDLRRADLLLAVGAELEQGWLPVAIERAGNPRIQPGQTGYFEAAAQVRLLDAEAEADRALGDVHPSGNPHVNLDPQRMSRIAEALALRLSELDSEHASAYQQRALNFSALLGQHLLQWQQQVKGAPGAVLHHRDADYLLHRLGVPVLGYIEPQPGVPPTAAQLQKLLTPLRGRQGVILRTTYQSPQGADFLQRELGWKVTALPLDPPLGATAEDYINLLQQWVNTLAPVS